MHTRQGSFDAVRSCEWRLGSVARALRANAGTASKAFARQLESGRNIGQAAFHIVGADEVATNRRELFPPRTEPDRQFKPAGFCTDSQRISPHPEEVGPVNKTGYQSERPPSPHFSLKNSKGCRFVA